MTVSIEKIKLPIQEYELLDNSSDDRFKRVKIWIAHSGENLNHSVFEKDTLVQMTKTLPLVPIVGYVEVNKDDEDDFSDHRQKITLKNNDIEIEYMCHAYGFIPEDHNAQIEYRDGKEWLTAEGYLWTKFEKAIEIFDDANGEKSHSMEIDNVQGFVDEEGRLNVTDARFSALCILGDHVSPGMAGSTIEYFNANSIKEEIRQMMVEFSRKGDRDLENEKELNEQAIDNQEFDKVYSNEEEKKEEFVEEQDKEDSESEEKTDAEDEDKEKEDFKKCEDEEKKEFKEDESPESDDVEVYSDDKEEEKKFELVYTLSHEDVRSKIYSALQKNDKWAWILKTFDDEVLYELEEYNDSEYTTRYFKSKYAIENEEVSIGETVEVFAEFLTKEEVDKVSADRSRISELEQELNSLKMEKSQAEQVSKNELIDSYSEKLSEEELTSLKDSTDKFSISELEKEIAYTLFKKQQEDTPTKAVFARNLENGEKDGRYGDLDRYFTK